MSSSPPRPKVFRLPPVASSSPPETPAKPARSNRVLRWGALLLTLGLILPALEMQAAAYFSHGAASTLPGADSSDFEGILQPPMADAQAALPADKAPTILLRGRSEAIIGQMAKIPADNEPVIEMRAASEVDNSAGHELLSIIRKY